MTKTTTATTTTSNGSTYEILIHHNWLNGTVTCMDDGRSYAFAADDAETIDEAIAEAADWCEWHSVHGNEHLLHEVAPEPIDVRGEIEMTKLTAKETAALTKLGKKADAQQLAEAAMPEWAAQHAIDTRIPVSVKVEHDGLEVETWTSKSRKVMHRVHFGDGTATEYCGDLDRVYVNWDRGGVRIG